MIIDTGAGPIEYAERGEGRPLLSIHGAGGGFDQGLANAAELVGDGFRVIAPSRFGYLRTPVPSDASPAAQADAHAALLSSRGIHRAIVLGVSAGARSAVELALRRPDLVERLLLIVPALHDAGHPPATDASRGSQFAFSLVNAGADFAWWIAEKLAPSMLVRFIGVPPALLAGAPAGERDRVMRIVRSIAPLSLRFPGINIDSAPCPTELPLERIAAPTLIISARDDLFATATAAEFAAGKIRDARLVLYDAGGHLLVGHSAEAQAAVRAFLDSPAATPRRVLSAAEG
ncbi:MAG TPA: alpha/beta hydrolase [Stellaceae bacterium]|nr:alpha/beta hydrolase [Stellaceae bacterium]